MGLKIKHIVFLLVLVLLCDTGYASWTGPSEVISGIWGNNPGQFAKRYGDSGADFPRLFCINSSGIIAIADEFNSRVQTYNDNGGLLASFGPQNLAESEGWKLGWPSRVGCMLNAVYTEFDKYTQLYEKNGVLITGWDNLQGGLVEIALNDDFYTRTASNYYVYSPTGQLLQTYNEKPLELGWVTEKKISNAQYKVTVKYPDKEWGIVGEGIFPYYMKDIKGNLYAVGETEVVRYNDCGKEVARLMKPDNRITSTARIFPEEPGDAPIIDEPIIRVLEEYGAPVLAPNGDVYTWKRTPDKYSIIKWTWQDDPNAPANVPDAPTKLAVVSSAAALTLTWEASLQDPGCVAGYEIGRSKTSGEGYSSIGTVDKRILKYEDATAEAGTTYYYKVRAGGGDGYSDYTVEANGVRPISQ